MEKTSVSELLHSRLQRRATLSAMITCEEFERVSASAAPVKAALRLEIEALWVQILNAAAALSRNDSNVIPSGVRKICTKIGRHLAEQHEPLRHLIDSFGVGSHHFFAGFTDDLFAAYPNLPSDTLSRMLNGTLANISQCIGVIAESYGESRHEPERRRQRRSEKFLADLIAHPDSGSFAEAVLAGLGDAGRYTVVVLPVGDAASGWGLTGPARGNVARSLESVRRSLAAGCLWGFFQEVAIIVVPVSGDDDHVIVDALCKSLEAALPLTYPRNRIIIAAGRPSPGFEGIKTSFEDALHVLNAARRLGLLGKVSWRDVLIPMMILSAPAVAHDLMSLLNPLLTPPSTRADLLNTLIAFLHADLSISETATSLCLHRNTLRQRLRRIETLIGGTIVDLRLTLELAVRARDLFPLSERKVQEVLISEPKQSVG